MGEVYRARDPRLKREVAIKVLPPSFSKDPDRLRRFEQEAQAAGALNHPNITAVYDLGTHEGAGVHRDGVLEGETLRSRLSSGGLAVRKGSGLCGSDCPGARRGAREGDRPPGLEAREPVLDPRRPRQDPRLRVGEVEVPGGARREDKPSDGDGGDRARRRDGHDGLYVAGASRGKAADKKSDLFSFGAILYEMLSGQRAFRGDSAADTITAILTKEPPDLTQTNKEIDPGLERIVRHCLEKNPEERFESARDLAFDLEALSGMSRPTGPVPMTEHRARRGWGMPVLAAALLALGVGLTAGYRLGKKAGYVPPPNYQQLSFRRGEVYSARFAPDGQTVIYAASWDGRPVEIFATRTDRARVARVRARGRRCRFDFESGRDARVRGPSRGGGLHPGRYARAGERFRRRCSARDLDGRAVGRLGRTGRVIRSSATSTRATSSSTRPAKCCIGRAVGSAIPRVSPDGEPSRSSTIPSGATTAARSSSWIALEREKCSRGSSRRSRGWPGLAMARKCGSPVRVWAATAPSIQSRSSGGTSSRARHREPDASGHFQRRSSPRLARRHSYRSPRTPAREKRRSAIFRGSTGRPRSISRTTARLSSSRRPEKARGRGTRVSSAGPTARRPFVLATGWHDDLSRTVAGCRRNTPREEHPKAWLYPTGRGREEGACRPGTCRPSLRRLASRRQAHRFHRERARPRQSDFSARRGGGESAVL